MALQDMRGGMVEPGGPMEPSTHCTCGSYGTRATPKLLSPPGHSSVSVLLDLLSQLRLEILIHVLTYIDCKSTRIYPCSSYTGAQYSDGGFGYIK